MSIDTCRQFILHNDFIPPAKEVHDWNYLAFGYVDGISVKKENIFDHKWYLDRLWSDSVKAKSELMKQESRQVIYGFRSEEDHENKEQLFWENEDENIEYPFLFFVMIQFEDAGRKDLQRLILHKQDVEKKYSKSENIKAITYLTLDNSDLLLVLKSRSYEDGAGIVDEIHRSGPFYRIEDQVWKVKYSFTIPAISKYYLNSDKIGQLKDHTLHRACIYVMEKTSGSIQPFYNFLEETLKDYIDKKSVLGYNDELILFSEIPWDRFLELYKDGSGLLNHSNDYFQKYVSSITTIIEFAQPYFQIEQLDSLTDDKIQKSFFGLLQSRLSKFVEKNKSIENDCMFLSLYHLVNSLSRFGKDSISENLFLPSALSVYLLIEILAEIFSEEMLLDLNICYQRYRQFLNGLNSYAQNPVRSDRQFTQVIEFNVKTYNLPIKLNAFYNAFVFRVKDFLNDTIKDQGQEHQYEFLTCPGVSLHMYVEELFEGYSDDKRLFLVNIPENQVYGLEQMMIMLCHEVGHFVGRSVRRRDDRTEYLLQALPRMITSYYRGRIADLAGEEFDSLWDSFHKNLYELMKMKYQEYYEKDKIADKLEQKDGNQVQRLYHAEKIAQYRKRLRNHGIIMKAALREASILAIRTEEEKVFGDLLYKSYMYNYRNNLDKRQAEKFRMRVWENLKDSSMDIVRVRDDDTNYIQIDNMIDRLMYICKEGLTDIIAIMILSFSCEQYMTVLFENARQQGDEDVVLNIEANEVKIRAALVTVCMIGKSEGRELGEGWEPKGKFSDEASDKVVEFFQLVKEFIKKYIYNKKQKGNIERISYNRVCDFFSDRILLRYIRKYLMGCREACAALMKEKGAELKKVRDMFAVSQADTIQSAMLQMEAVIDEYRSQVQDKMHQIVKYRTVDKGES